jgi:tetratricopeptide (TPR) repeat protein
MLKKSQAKPVIIIFTAVFTFLWAVIPSPAGADTQKAKENFNAGVKAMEAGKVDEAILAYKAAISEDPEFVDSYLNLGAIYFEQKDYEKAREMFQTATEKDKTNAIAFANLGRVEYVLKKYVEAEAAFQTAISLDKNNPELYKELGKVYYKKRDYPKVVETISKCHELGGGDYNTYYMLGKGFQKQDKTQKAIEAFKKSIELKDNYRARSALGRIYLAQEKFKQAARQFQAALKVEPKGWRAAYNYAVAVQSSDPENYDANIKAWQRFVKLAKNIPKAKNQVAEAKRVIKDLQEAKKQAELQ